MEFTTKMKEMNRFYCHPSEICSINVTYTQTTSVKTFSPTGGGEQKADSFSPSKVSEKKLIS